MSREKVEIDNKNEKKNEESIYIGYIETYESANISKTERIRRRKNKAKDKEKDYDDWN